MPTYEYVCTACGERTDAVQKFTDDPLTVCPHCGGSLRKLFSSVGVVFKGSGFYRTDSRGATSDTPKKDSAPAKESAPAKGTSTSTAKTEAAPAAS